MTLYYMSESMYYMSEDMYRDYSREEMLCYTAERKYDNIMSPDHIAEKHVAMLCAQLELCISRHGAAAAVPHHAHLCTSLHSTRRKMCDQCQA